MLLPTTTECPSTHSQVHKARRNTQEKGTFSTAKSPKNIPSNEALMSRRHEFSILATHVSELINLTNHLAGLCQCLHNVLMKDSWASNLNLLSLSQHEKQKYLNEVPQLYFKPLTTKS